MNKHWSLCYGENRRQGNANLLVPKGSEPVPFAVVNLNQISGTEPSFINVTDIDRLFGTATRIGSGFKVNFGIVPLIAIAVKHGNACGAAIGDDSNEVLQELVEGDPDAISGGIVLVNFKLKKEGTSILRKHMMAKNSKRILDGVVAPAFTSAAVNDLIRTNGRCRLFVDEDLKNEGLGEASIDASERYRQVRGGMLVQDGDPFVLKLPESWQISLSLQQSRDIVLGWAIGSTSNSNTIVLTKNSMLIGAGTGQRSRVMACKLALLYADTYGHEIEGAIAYSDSFFPFPDGPEALARAGVSVIFATSGSIRDEEIAIACEKAHVILLTLPDSETRGFFGH